MDTIAPYDPQSRSGTAKLSPRTRRDGACSTVVCRIETGDCATSPFFHDGTERPINRPTDRDEQEFYYSGKQKDHTVKNILLVDTTGYIVFLSDTYEGKAHDKRIADEAGYTLPAGSELYQDTGFQGFDLPGVVIIQ